MASYDTLTRMSMILDWKLLVRLFVGTEGKTIIWHYWRQQQLWRHIIILFPPGRLFVAFGQEKFPMHAQLAGVFWYVRIRKERARAGHVMHRFFLLDLVYKHFYQGLPSLANMYPLARCQRVNDSVRKRIGTWHAVNLKRLVCIEMAYAHSTLQRFEGQKTAIMYLVRTGSSMEMPVS